MAYKINASIKKDSITYNKSLILMQLNKKVKKPVGKNIHSIYESEFAKLLDISMHVFTFWKGRVALYAILRALDIRPGDEVILPAFTCVAVANVVLYLGAKPVYADIDPYTYNIDVDKIACLITPRTKVVISQNTFGLSPDLDPIMNFAENQGIHVIEDCAHGLGSLYKGRSAGTNTHAAFFSTQWSKPITTGLGGIAFVRDSDVADKVAKLTCQFASPTLFDGLILLTQHIMRPMADYPLLYYPLVDMYRTVTQRLGLKVGSSVGTEITTTEMPNGYLKKMGRLQHVCLKRGLVHLNTIIEKRRKVAAYYDEFFSSTRISLPFRPRYSDHGMLRYAIRVSNKAKVLVRARRLRIPLGDWFISPLHPVEGDLSIWGYQLGQCPEAERACKEVVNLFTDIRIPEERLKKLFCDCL